MADYIQIPVDWLKANAEGTRDDVHLYWRGFFLARRAMWGRLESFINLVKRNTTGGKVLDVGGGLGLLLPNLSQIFNEVTLLDLETSIAEKVKHKYVLSSRIVRANVMQPPADLTGFDVVVAAAFLEHFQTTMDPVGQITKFLKPGGLLIVDLPTENWVYRLGRAVGSIQKPPDHYHGAADIKKVILSRFDLIEEQYLPMRPFALFYQGVFKLRNG